MARINNDYRYTITDQLGNLIAQPIGESDFSIEWSREQDNGKRQYERDFGGNIVFIGEAYQRLLSLEDSIYRCQLQEITIERKCSGEWQEWFAGHISLNEGDWDLDGCKVTLKFEEAKADECFEKNKSVELDLFREVFPRETIRMHPGTVTIDTIICRFEEPAPGENEDAVHGYYWCEAGDPQDYGWVPYYHLETINNDEHRVRTHWARQVLILSCTETAPPDWILIEDRCALSGDRVYARPANLYQCTYTFNDPDDPEYRYYHFEECKVFGQTGSATEFRNGFRLDRVLKAFVDEFCRGTTIKSDFFQINPDNPSTTNYVTNAPSKVLNIFIFQKTDIKRPTASSGATRGLWTFEKLMQTLKYMFNVEWRIDGGLFVLEHVSFFTKNIGMDLRLPKYDRFTNGKRRYTYKNEDVPSEERWLWKEPQSYGDFAGRPIIYTSGCVTTGSKDAVKTYAMDDVITDVELAISHPSPDSTVVSDEGFVFVATDHSGGQYSILMEAGILSTPRLNNTLALAQLHRDYHKYERPLRIGRMNDVETEFYSSLPTKQGTTIKIPLCCADNFNPDNLIYTQLGAGVVDKATFNFKDGTLDLDLLYESNLGLVPNTKPTAANQVAVTYEDEYVDINLLNGWVDPDPGAQVTEAFLTNQPSNGTVTISPSFIARYTPNTGFVGNDIFTFRLKDDWGAESNTAIATITVRPENFPPEANDDFYQVLADTHLTVPAPGVFLNDTDDIGFTLDSYDQTGTSGGTVVIGTDGKLDYDPPTGFEGTDTFTYTIIDERGMTDSATVTVTVSSPNNPVAVADFYMTRVDLSVEGIEGDGTTPGLLDNDYTPSGTQPLTATSGTFGTSKGGSVTIDTDGSFIYTPPTGFTGTDTFTYTVSNNDGSALGVATVTVIPNVYVRMSSYGEVEDSIIKSCPSGPLFSGEIKRKTVAFEFYSNPAGTTPMDVTGINLLLNINDRTKEEDIQDPWTDMFIQFPASGTIIDYVPDMIYYHIESDCDSILMIAYERQIILLPSNNYIII